jgi:hypothetical protein
MHEDGKRRNKIMVTGRSFYCKNKLTFKGRNRNLNPNRAGAGTVGKKIGTRNRNLGKMARFRNTAGDCLVYILQYERPTRRIQTTIGCLEFFKQGKKSLLKF